MVGSVHLPLEHPGLASSALSLGHACDEGVGGHVLPWLCFAQSCVGRGACDGGAARRAGQVKVLWGEHEETNPRVWVKPSQIRVLPRSGDNVALGWSRRPC